jgi:ABC-type sugar transport system substrate-binding protein
MNRKRWVVALCLAGSLVLAACGGQSSSSGTATKKIRIGYSSDALSQPAQAEGHFGAVAQAQKLGVQLYETHAPDAAGQASGIEDLFAKGIDVLAVDPNDGKAIGTLVKEANSRHIPVVMFVGANEGGGNTSTLITTDEQQGGYQISTAMFKKINGTGQVGFIQGCICHPAGAAREAGFKQALAESPGIKLAAYGSTDWDPVKANQLATDMLSKNSNIDAFIALTDPMADAAHRAVLATNGKNHAIVSGYNGVCSALARIWSGDQTATLDQNWRGIGSQVVDTSVAIAKGQKVDSKIILPSYVIDKPAMEQIQKGSFPNQTPALAASVKSAISGCPSA